MKLTDFYFDLPGNLIAQSPLPERGQSRLMVLLKNGSIEHSQFDRLTEYLEEGDMLILNNTKVFPARLSGKKTTGGKIDLLFVRQAGEDIWEVLSRERYTGRVLVSEELSLEIYEGKTARLLNTGGVMEALWLYGDMPLPPYIKRKADASDKERYQTVYAEKEGSIAAPTAGLHFTKELMESLRSGGILIRYVTLHIGTGTFKPVKAADVKGHVMDPEYFEVDRKLICEIEEVKKSGKRVITVGTTATRALEGLVSGNWSPASGGSTTPIKGFTDIFICPGYKFRVADSLITNFHLPCSTPLMLASALYGTKKLLKAYDTAISRQYRFFSYGDAMLVL